MSDWQVNQNTLQSKTRKKEQFTSNAPCVIYIASLKLCSKHYKYITLPNAQIYILYTEYIMCYDILPPTLTF